MQMPEQPLVLPPTTAEKQHEKALEREIVEGCREMAEIYLEIQRELEPLDTEVTRAFYPQ